MTEALEQLVAELATEVLDSFEKLEVLAHIASADGPQTVDALCEHVKLDRDAIQDALASLVAHGAIVALANGYVAETEGPWSAHVRALAKLYRSDRMKVVTLMSEAAMKRLRLKTERAFADAFLFRPRRDENDG